MTTKRKVGRPSIFPNRTERFTGFVSKDAQRLLKGHKAVLAQAAGFRGTVSDGDVAEYLARGQADTSEVLRQRKR